MNKLQISTRVVFNVFVTLLLFVSFVYSTQIAFGINDAKNYYFQVVMLFGIGLYGVGLYKIRNNEFQKYSLFDILYVSAILYLSIRTYPFIDEFLNFQLFIVLYFVIKQGMFHSQYYNKLTLIDKNCVFFIVIIELIVIFQSIIGILQLYGIIESLNPRYIITGTTANPAYFSFFLAATFPLILSIYIYLSISVRQISGLKILTYFAFLSIVIVLVMTQNRSSWVSLVLSSLFLILCTKNYRVIIKTVMVSRVVRIFCVILFFIFLIIGLIFIYNFKYESSYGRLLIWKISSGMVFENPIFGIGFNKFEVLYTICQQKYFSNDDFSFHDVQVADYVQVAYNEYLQLLIETGIIGLLLFIIFILYFLWQFIKYLKVTSQSESYDLYYFFNIGLFVSVLSIFIMSIFSYPLHYLPVKIVFIVNIAIISNLFKGRFVEMKRNNFYLKCFYLFSICLLIIYNLMNINYKVMWKSAIKKYDKGYYEESYSIYQDIYPHMKTNGLFLLYYGTTLNVCKDYDSSIRILEGAKEYISDPILFLKLGDNYKFRKQYELAEQNYLFASKIVPNRLYPHFLLALLYSNENCLNLQKFDEVSNYILSFEPKIDSKAICEMKDSITEIRKKIFLSKK